MKNLVKTLALSTAISLVASTTATIAAAQSLVIKSQKVVTKTGMPQVTKS